MDTPLALFVLPLLCATADTKAIVEIASKPLVECDSIPVCLATNEKGAVLLVATDKGHVSAWNVAKSEFTWRNKPGGYADNHEAASPLDAPYLRALDAGDKIAFLGRGLPTPASLELASGKETGGYMTLVADPAVQIVDLRCDPKDRWAWMAFDNGLLARYTPNAPTQYNSRALKDVRIRSLAYSAEASLVAAGSTKGTIHFVNASSANVDDAKLFKGPESAVCALEFANKGALLLAGDEKGDVTVWTVASGKSKQTVHAGGAALKRILVHPRNKWFVTGDAAGAVKVWTLDKGEPVTVLKAEGATSVFDLELVDGGKTLVGALGGKSILAWDVSKL